VDALDKRRLECALRAGGLGRRQAVIAVAVVNRFLTGQEQPQGGGRAGGGARADEQHQVGREPGAGTTGRPDEGRAR